jgi:hypothetical protein
MHKAETEPGTDSPTAGAGINISESTRDDHDVVQDEEDRILDEIERGILDVFSDAYCNKHLVYSLVERVLVRLLPELAENGVVDLWAERLA